MLCIWLLMLTIYFQKMNFKIISMIVALSLTFSMANRRMQSGYYKGSYIKCIDCKEPTQEKPKKYWPWTPGLKLDDPDYIWPLFFSG